MLTSRSGKRDSVIQLASTACLPGGVRSGYIQLPPTTSFCRDVGALLEIFQHIWPGRAPAQQGFRLLARCLLVQNQSIGGGTELASRLFQRPSRRFAARPGASAGSGSDIGHPERRSADPEEQSAGRGLLQREEIQLRQIVHVDEGPSILSGTNVARKTFLLRRFHESSRNTAAPAIHDGRPDHYASDAAGPGLKHPVLYRLPPAYQLGRPGRRGLVHHFATGIAVRPDAAGIDEGLVAARERVKNGVDGRAIDRWIVGCRQADHAVGLTSRGGYASGIGEVASHRANTGSSELAGRSVAPGQCAHFMPRRPKPFSHGAADVSSGAGQKYLHTCYPQVRDRTCD